MWISIWNVFRSFPTNNYSERKTVSENSVSKVVNETENLTIKTLAEKVKESPQVMHAMRDLAYMKNDDNTNRHFYDSRDKREHQQTIYTHLGTVDGGKALDKIHDIIRRIDESV